MRRIQWELREPVSIRKRSWGEAFYGTDAFILGALVCLHRFVYRFFRYNGALRYHSIVSAITATDTQADVAYDSTDTITNSAADARAVTLAYDITFGCTYSFADS